MLLESLSSSSTTSQHMPVFDTPVNSNGRQSDTSANNLSSGNSYMGNYVQCYLEL